MTNEEAIKFIALIRKSEHIDIIKKDDALSKAMDALEKQIPKKTWNGHCPSCNVELDIWNYCPVCGQALNDNEST